MSRIGQAIRHARSPAKREAIIGAARALFFAHGVDVVAIEDIAARAGVSKVTVYAHFGDKDTLLEAVIRAEAARIEQSLLRPRARGMALEDVLNGVGEGLLAFLTAPEMEACDRILAAQAARRPDLARRFYEAGPGHVHAQVAALLAGAVAAGEVAADEPTRMAEDLMGLWKGMLPVARRFGVMPVVTPGERAARVARGTRLFLRAHAVARPEQAAPSTVVPE